MANAILNFHFDYWHTSLTCHPDQFKRMSPNILFQFLWDGWRGSKNPCGTIITASCHVVLGRRSLYPFYLASQLGSRRRWTSWREEPGWRGLEECRGFWKIFWFVLNCLWALSIYWALNGWNWDQLNESEGFIIINEISHLVSAL